MPAGTHHFGHTPYFGWAISQHTPHSKMSTFESYSSASRSSSLARVICPQTAHNAFLGSCGARHCFCTQHCFVVPGPANFTMSRQKWHSRHSARRHGSHRRHRMRRLEGPFSPPGDRGRAGFTSRGSFERRGFWRERRKGKEEEQEGGDRLRKRRRSSMETRL